MRRVVALCFLVLLPAAHASAQSATPAVPTTANNMVYGEFLGNALAYSVNYERLVAPTVSLRAGAMFVATGDPDGSTTATVMPFMVNYLSGKGRHHFEAGAGALVVVGTWNPRVGNLKSGTDTGVASTFTIGYRYQKPEGGLMARVAFTPAYVPSFGFWPWFGVAVGKSF